MSEQEMEYNPITPEYEVFLNGQNAVAFFMHRHPVLDANDDMGPFWFAVHNEDTLVAGTETNYTILPQVTPEIIDIARQRRVIMLVEFENQKAIRCTPCYLSTVSD